MGNTRYDNRYDHENIRSLIRKAFVPKRDFLVKEEVVPCEASLLQIEKLVSPISMQDDKPFFPSQDIVKTIVDWDTNAQNKVLSPEELALIEKMKKMGYPIPEPTDPHPERKQTYHYLPYRFDSGLEREFFKDSVLPILGEYKSQLEIYFNGDDTLTDFKIDCYKQSAESGGISVNMCPTFCY